MKKNGILKRCFLAMMVSACILSACTKYETPPDVEDVVSDKEGQINIRKFVLWVNLEGAGGGDLVKNALPDDGAIKGLLPRSRYAWNGLESEHGEDHYVPTEENAIASASMLTGNQPLRHGIQDNTYTSEQYFDPDFDEAIKTYPGFFQYVAEYDKGMSTLAVTPWGVQNETLFNEATRVVTTTSDEETLGVVLQQLEEENNRITYVSFRGVLDAARQGGWKPDNADYRNAMHTMDDYVDQILQAIEDREEAYFEDWLIIVTSNHGGTTDGKYGGTSREERNMFGIFHFDHFSKSKEMDADIIEAFRFDQSFRGVVIDSLTYKTDSRTDVDVWRQIYSLDSLGGGMTVEYIMGVAPSKSRSYVPGDQNGVTLFEKSGRWNVRVDHTYNSTTGSFFGKSDGNVTNAGYYTNPYIHSFTSTVNFKNTSGYVATEAVGETLDRWGNIIPAYDKSTYRRKGDVDVKTYYDGIQIGAGSNDNLFDQPSSWFLDNRNIDIYDNMRWMWRYLLEIRIWKKQLTDNEITQYSSQLKLTPANCSIYDNLIGYWQFYKGENGQYIEDDSLVVNQIKTVNKRIVENGKEMVREIPTEPIHLRKKNEEGRYVPISKEDVKYVEILNTISKERGEEGRAMESTMVVPAILEWMEVPYPIEATRASSGGTSFSRLDGVYKIVDPVTRNTVWLGDFLGDYSTDLEWRDYER